MSTINPSKDLLSDLLGGQRLPDDQYRKVVQLRDMLDKLLILDASKRLTVNLVFDHDFFTEKI